MPESVAQCHQYSRQGIAALEQGQDEQATKYLAQAVAASPNNLEARRYYAEALWQQGKSDAAMREMQSALSCDGADSTLAVRAGEMRLALGDADRAADLADRALNLDPRNPKAWALRSQVMLKRNDPHRALADLHRGLSFSPDDPSMLLQMAEIYRDHNQPEHALHSLDHLASLYSPGEEPQHVLYMTGLVYVQLGRYNDAVESLYAACCRGELSADLLYRLADAESKSGRTTVAMANVRQALTLDPNHVACRQLFEELRTAQAPGGNVRRQ